MESFKAFRGQEPDTSALLKRRGLKATNSFKFNCFVLITTTFNLFTLHVGWVERSDTQRKEPSSYQSVDARNKFQQKGA